MEDVNLPRTRQKSFNRVSFGDRLKVTPAWSYFEAVAMMRSSFFSSIAATPQRQGRRRE